jgi:hypothetical protein
MFILDCHTSVIRLLGFMVTRGIRHRQLLTGVFSAP